MTWLKFLLDSSTKVIVLIPNEIEIIISSTKRKENLLLNHLTNHLFKWDYTRFDWSYFKELFRFWQNVDL